ncbi:putative AP-3 complex subunit delta [Talaromyces proteolyticus]|uniref:AP-3 complex subunit delta n=1 Tax=Talaromyces proteolyticus TaxID=1131652 RepID=A0AAD4Q108_9EURO|nr:putative AP-3 complex subunit delta [Talaromyces proteolyticus]KAH8698249.1 putative AP-3 complex subunit delta [Talaromyces proteolyticus]
MFEKSLYDLIRGLRGHKGSEVEYIQNSLRECRSEIKSQDMDKKAIALLKLIYLEMFGYDMSWASFHVLEVMSAPKYLQKRVGYLAAAQSFRAETEVLMLATNLLKKDIVSSSVVNLLLPLATLPHILTPSLAMSLLNDILPRLSHSNTTIRKKSIVVLYRLALVYPESLKAAWPKIKERLMDENEDNSVIAAVVNVVCELGWRRPHDFLPLAPRFFELLVDSGNNWMAIKIIKLFATLIPLEPRLVRKLLRPLISIIQTTSAMSLLYECINGIIQGGILTEAEGTQEGDEIAGLCVAKLRGMVVLDADPNLKYVALLAFNRIVLSHPELVAMQQTVIMDCLDDADISIRLQALELVVQMVTSETLQDTVNRLIVQLLKGHELDLEPNRDNSVDIESNPNISSQISQSVSENQRSRTQLDLPSEYRNEVFTRILDICSRDNYSDIIDFEWYVNILGQLLKLLLRLNVGSFTLYNDESMQESPEADIAMRIGSEIRNIAVRVKAIRKEATRTAESFLFLADHQQTQRTITSPHVGALGPSAWLAGEFADCLAFPDRVLNILISPNSKGLPGATLALYLQAMPKIFLQLLSSQPEFSTSSYAEYSITLARLITFLEDLGAHPDLDVQERATEFLELLRLSEDALKSRFDTAQEVPFLLTWVIPGIFKGFDLNSVAIGAQKKVPLPEHLDLDEAINDKLPRALDNSFEKWMEPKEYNSIHSFYYIQQDSTSIHWDNSLGAQADTSSIITEQLKDYGKLSDHHLIRKDYSRDDPFYIGHHEGNLEKADTYNFLDVNNDELDIDSIPIIDLRMGDGPSASSLAGGQSMDVEKLRTRPGRFEIAADETIDADESYSSESLNPRVESKPRSQRSLLQVDSSGLERMTLVDSHQNPSVQPKVIQGAEELEMAEAMRKIEGLRLEMQRASERINVDGIPSEGTLIKKKKLKRKKRPKTKVSSKAEVEETSE